MKALIGVLLFTTVALGQTEDAAFWKARAEGYHAELVKAQAENDKLAARIRQLEAENAKLKAAPKEPGLSEDPAIVLKSLSSVREQIGMRSPFAPTDPKGTQAWLARQKYFVGQSIVWQLPAKGIRSENITPDLAAKEYLANEQKLEQRPVPSGSYRWAWEEPLCLANRNWSLMMQAAWKAQMAKAEGNHITVKDGTVGIEMFSKDAPPAGARTIVVTGKIESAEYSHGEWSFLVTGRLSPGH